MKSNSNETMVNLSIVLSTIVFLVACSKTEIIPNEPVTTGTTTDSVIVKTQRTRPPRTASPRIPRWIQSRPPLRRTPSLLFFHKIPSQRYSIGRRYPYLTISSLSRRNLYGKHYDRPTQGQFDGSGIRGELL